MSAWVEIMLSGVGFNYYADSLAELTRHDLEVRFTEVHEESGTLFDHWEGHSPDLIITQNLKYATDTILNLKLPTILLSGVEATPETVCIRSDDTLVGEMAAEYFFNRGYTHYAFVGNGTLFSVARHRGFVKQLAAFSIAAPHFMDIEDDHIHYWEYQKMKNNRLREWLLELPKPVAVFTANDPLARYVCQEGKAAGVLIPQSMAVLGVDNFLPLCQLCSPRLSSIEVDWAGMGELAASLALRILEGEALGGKIFSVPPESVETRETTDVFAVNDLDVCRAMHWMRKHYRESVSIEMLCDQLHMNRRKLERGFREHLRCSPLEELARVRIEVAKRLLLRTRYSVDHIADECGYCNAAYFSKQFKKATKRSPKQYRQQLNL